MQTQRKEKKTRLFPSESWKSCFCFLSWDLVFFFLNWKLAKPNCKTKLGKKLFLRENQKQWNQRIFFSLHQANKKKQLQWISKKKGKTESLFGKNESIVPKRMHFRRKQKTKVFSFLRQKSTFLRKMGFLYENKVCWFYLFSGFFETGNNLFSL